MMPALTPSLSWLLLSGVALFVALVVYGVLVTGSRGSRFDERLPRPQSRKVYQLDHTKIPLALRRQQERAERHRRFKGVSRGVPAEVPPDRGAA